MKTTYKLLTFGRSKSELTHQRRKIELIWKREKKKIAQTAVWKYVHADGKYKTKDNV